MKIETINKLCCPFDKKDLKLTIVKKDLTEDIMEGYLICQDCKRLYPIVSGIPIMSPDEYREFHLEEPLLQKWTKYLKDTEVKNFRIMPSNQDLIE